MLFFKRKTINSVKSQIHHSMSQSSKRFNDLEYETLEFNLTSNVSKKNVFGFKIAGYCPCYIDSIESNSISSQLGLKRFDLIMKINNINCCRATLKTILNLIKSNQSSLLLTINRVKSKSKNSNRTKIPSSMSTVLNCGDSGYDSISREYSNESHKNSDSTRMCLIKNLIKLEDEFVDYLNNAVATLVRPLRSFFTQQTHYFSLFQNIEKILVISENFLISMKKWSEYDLHTRIDHLYTQKLNLIYDAFKIYSNGYLASKTLYKELESNSKQFRLFLKETESNTLNLESLLDSPIIYLSHMMNIFKEMKEIESKNKKIESFQIHSIIFRLQQILDANTDEIYKYFESESNEETQSLDSSKSISIDSF